MEKKKISGKEVRYLLKQNSVNLSWLSEQLGISAQAMQERLKAQEFKAGYLLEILEYCVGQTMKANRPIFNYAQVMSRHANEAIRKILDNIKHTAVLTDNGM